MRDINETGHTSCRSANAPGRRFEAPVHNKVDDSAAPSQNPN